MPGVSPSAGVKYLAATYLLVSCRREGRWCRGTCACGRGRREGREESAVSWALVVLCSCGVGGMIAAQEHHTPVAVMSSRRAAVQGARQSG
jgi:hypothetical protein